VRASYGLTPTDYRYTGQLEQAELGLYYYVARWYDPYLNHWVQPDTYVPESQGVLGRDRYAYASFNPIKYNDPTGHFPWIPVIAGAAALYMYTSSIGLIPDVVGIAKVYLATGSNGVSIEVAAGLAVQGEYAGPIDNILSLIAHGEWQSSESGFGMAQTGAEEMSKFGINGSATDPNVAVQVMQARIQEAQGACNGCNDFNMLVAAGIGQNGYISPGEISDASSTGNWDGILRKPGGDLNARFRMFMDPSNKNYNQIALLKYGQDLRALYMLGWQRPDGMTEDEFNHYLKNLVNLANGSQNGQ